jgi:hypothetical protein
MKIMIKCELTNDEKIAVGDELSEAQAALEAVESEKKLQNGVLNGRIKGLKGKVHELSQQWITGAGEREEDVEEQPSADGSSIIQTRISDGVKVGERPVNDNDRQATLAFSQKMIDNAKDRSEEQVVASTPEEAEEIRAARLLEEKVARAEADEIAKLAAEQAADDPKAKRIATGGGLKAPKKKKRMTVVDGDGKELDLDSARSPSEQVSDMVELVMATATFTNFEQDTAGRVEFIDRTGDVESRLIVQSNGTDAADARFEMVKKLTEYAAERLAAGGRILPIVAANGEPSKPGEGLAF